MKKITLRGRKIISNILKGFSLTTVMFVFQSCYGTPMTYYGSEVLVKGTVVSGSNNKGVKGIKVSALAFQQNDTASSEGRHKMSIDDSPSGNYILTDNSGKFSFFVNYYADRVIVFEDIDSTENGLYERQEVSIRNNGGSDEIQINVILKEIKQDSVSL